jgi:hypothetical protein
MINDYYQTERKTSLNSFATFASEALSNPNTERWLYIKVVQLAANRPGHAISSAW